MVQTKVGGRLFITAQIELSSGPGPVRFMAAERCTPNLGSQPDRVLQKPPLALATVLVALPLLALPLLPTGAALAQKRIPKLPGYDECPLGYVNDLKQHCNSPIDYEVMPTNGKACPSGWMNIGAGYCKKKTLGIF
jgi:hypothetical protein